MSEKFVHSVCLDLRKLYLTSGCTDPEGLNFVPLCLMFVGCQ